MFLSFDHSLRPIKNTQFLEQLIDVNLDGLLTDA